MKKYVFLLLVLLVWARGSQAQYTLPFTETFPSSSALPAGWVSWQSAGTGEFWTADFGMGGTSDGCAFSWYDGTIWLISKAITVPAGGSVDISFYQKAGWPSSYFKHGLYYSTTGAQNLGAWTAINADLGPADWNWAITPTYTLTGYAGTTIYIAWEFEGTFADGWYVDNFHMEVTNPCAAPTAVNATSITNNSALLGWTAPSAAPSNGYQIYYSTSSTDPTSSTVPTASVGAGITTYSMSSLSANTVYYAWVRSNCGGSPGSWTPVYSFTTLCNPVSVFPFNEGFETGYTDQQPVGGCWTQDGGTYNYYWTANSSQTMFNRSPRTGSWDATILHYGNPWMFRKFSLTAGMTYTVSCWAKQDGSTPGDATMELKYGTVATPAGMTGAIQSPTGLTTTYAQISGSFAPPATGEYYIGFHGVINGTPMYLTMDDIQVSEAYSCLPPTAIAATALTQTSASIAWTPPASAPSGGYDIYYSTSPTPPTISTTPTASVAAGVTSYTMTPLTLGTTYYLWIRSNCGGGELSSWSAVCSFSTHTTVPTTATVPGNYPNLTGVGGAFEAINCGGLNGNTTISITADLVEPGTIALNAWTENPPSSNYTLLIKPDASTLRTISGSLTYTASLPALIRTNGASRFTIDGQAGKLLTFRNTTATPATTAGTILFNNSSQNCYLKNSTIECNYNSTTYGTVTVGNTGSNSVEISGNDIRDATAGTTGNPAVGFYCASSTSSLNILNNNVYNFTNYGILMVTAANGAVISGNSIFYNSSTPPGASQYGIYMIPATFNHLITNNYIGGQAPLCQGNAWTCPGSFFFTGIYINGTNAGPITASNNTIRNIAMTGAGTPNFYGITIVDGLFNIMNNTVGSESVEGAISYAGTGNVYGLWLSSVNPANAVENNVFGNWSLTAATGTPTVYGMYVYSVNAKKNRIFGISASNAALTPNIYGVWTHGDNYIVNEYSNNIISLDGGAATNPTIWGFYNQGWTNENLKLYYNDIHISGPPTVTSSTFVFYSFINSNLDFKNNIFSNLRGAGGTGKHYVIHLTGTPNILNSDYNDLYSVAGPLTHYSEADQNNLVAWQNATGKDAHSISTDPLFVSSSDLHPQQPLLVAGTPVATVTTDYSGITRATVPTIGAYELPQVTTTAATSVTQISAIVNGTVNGCSHSVVTSFDYGLTTSYGSSVAAAPSPVTGTTSTAISASLSGLTPNTLYHYRAVGTVGSAKYYGADFTFTLAPACPVPIAVTATSIGQTTASIAWTPPAPPPSGGYDIYYSTSPTPPTISTTPTASVAAGVTSYTMTPLTLGTTYYVWVRSNCGSGDLSTWSTVYSLTTHSPVPTTATVPGTYPNLTGVGGAFEAINCGGLNGNTTINITTDLTEPGTYALNAWTENPPSSNYTLLIKPDASTLRTISGTLTYSASLPALIRTNGASRFTIDGQAGKLLTFRNTTATPATTAGTILFNNGSQNCYLKNSTIENNSSSTSYGTVTVGSTGTNSVGISGNDIRDATAGTAGLQCVGIYCSSETNSLSVTNNNVYNFKDYGVLMITAANGAVISGNSFYYNSSTATTGWQHSIYIMPATINHQVTGNYIGGQAPLCQGGPWNSDGTSFFTGINATGSNSGPTTISNNVIGNIAMNGSGVQEFYGMKIGSGLFNITNNTVGSATVAGSVSFAGTGKLYGLYLTSNNQANTAENNIFGNWSLTAASGTPTVYGMYVYSVNARKNKIFGISASNAALTPLIYGIYTKFQNLIINEFSNNIITLDAGAATDPTIYGLYNLHLDDMNLKLFYNTILISGPPTTSSSTYAAYINKSILEFKDNIFANSRAAGGTGKHYALYILDSHPLSTTDYSDFYSVAGPLCHFQSADLYNLAAWQTASGQDAHSISTNPLFVSATDLHPQQPLLVAGTPVATVTTDYSGITRATVPTIGAYEMPQVTTTAATSVTQTGATLNGTVNACAQNVVTSFEYGLTTAYGSTVAATPLNVTGNISTSITKALTGLTANTLYHYRAVGTVGTLKYYGADFTVDMVPTPSITSGPTVVCSGVAGNVYTTQAGKQNYAWTVVGGTITAGGTSASNTATITWNTAGMQSVSVNYQNSNGIPGPSPAVYNVTVNPASVGGSITPASVTIVIGSSTGTLTLGSYTGAVQKWQKRFNGGSWTDIVNTLPTYSEIPGAVGVYDYRAEVMSGSCSSAYSAVSTVTVNYPNLVPGTVAQSATICSGSSAPTLTSTPPNGTSPTYQWQSSTDNVVFTNIAGQVSATYSPGTITATTYYRQMQNSTGTSGGPLPTNSVTIAVNPLPVPTITGPTSLCATAGYTNYLTETGMSGYTWTVSAGGSIVAGQGTHYVTVSWSAPGAQWIKVNYNNAFGCSAATATQLNVTVNGIPGTAGAITGPSSVCAPSTGISYSVAPVPGATAYSWTLPQGASVVSGQYTNSITVDFAANALPGPMTVSANNICGNGASSPPVQIAVTYLPGSAGAITGLEEICQDVSGVAYSVAPIANASGYTWTLPIGATIASGANTNSIYVDFGPNAVSGNVTVFGTNSCGVGTVSPSFAVNVKPQPPTPVVTASGNTLTSSAPAGNQWFWNGSAVTGATSQVYNVPVGNPGWYRTVVGLDGCYSDSSNQVYVAGVGMGENESGFARIYPVPNKGLFTAELGSSHAEDFRIQIFNTLGVMVHQTSEFRVNGIHQENLDVQQLPDGMYSVIFISQERKIVRKFLKQDR